MRASVVIVTYNHARDVGRCLEALLPTLGHEDEVVVVDNASEDASAEAALMRGVRVERLQRNVGFGAACNYAARHSRADVLVFLNPDTVPRAGWLDALLNGLRHGDLATAKLLHLSDPDRIDAFGNDLHISGIPTCRGWGEASINRAQVEEVAAVSGACFALSRSVFEQLGGFDERLFLYYEDDDLSLRARLAGLRCVAIPDAVVLHDHRPGFSPSKLRYLERNRWWSLLKVYRWRTLLVLLPVLLGAEAIAWGMALRCGPAHIAAKCQAWIDIARWLPRLPPARAAIQCGRERGDRELLELHSERLPLAQVARGRVAAHVEAFLGVFFRVPRTVALHLLVASN